MSVVSSKKVWVAFFRFLGALVVFEPVAVGAVLCTRLILALMSCDGARGLRQVLAATLMWLFGIFNCIVYNWLISLLLGREVSVWGYLNNTAHEFIVAFEAVRRIRKW